MKLHGEDKLMIISKRNRKKVCLPGAYRVIDSNVNNCFIVKMWNPRSGLHRNRRFDKRLFSYFVRRSHAGV